MSNQDQNFSQTEFSQSEPFFSEVGVPLLPDEENELYVLQQKQKKQRQLLTIFGLIMTGLIITVVLFAVFRPALVIQPDQGPGATATPTLKISSQLEQELEQMDKSVKNADPNSDEFLFPPLEMELGLGK